MKYSGIPWIGSLPDSWQIKKVKNCFYISKEKANENNPVVLSLARSGVKIRDISNNEGQLAASYENYNPVVPGDLLLNTMDLYSGANCNVSEVSGVISPAYANLRTKANLNPKYFDYYFKTQYWSMAMFAHGKGISFDNRWTLNNDGLLNYYLPFPSVEQQNQIVKCIEKNCSEIDELIEVEKKQIEILKEYKYTHVKDILKNNNLFGGYDFKRRKFKTLATLCNGKEITVEGGSIPVYGSGGIFKFTDKPIMAGESLLMGRKGTIDNPMIVEGAFWTVDTMFYTSSFNDCVGRYLYYLCAYMIDYGYFKSGSVLPSMTQTDINNIYFDVAPIEKQIEIVSFLDAQCHEIDGLIELKNKKIDQLKEYQKSLIYEYVTGKKEVKA